VCSVSSSSGQYKKRLFSNKLAFSNRSCYLARIFLIASRLTRLINNPKCGDLAFQLSNIIYFKKSLFFSNSHKRLISASALQSKETYIHMWVYCSLSIYLGLNAPGHLSNKPHYSTSEEREGESVSYNNNYELKANPITKLCS